MTPIFAAGVDIERAKTTYLADQPMFVPPPSRRARNHPTDISPNRARFAHPDEVAAGIVFTVMDGASFMTGSDWGPDGGHHTH
jgi:NAD(P)-dependent dehydrogenase (short-subunit alcohol dehydrogenase family)